MQLKDLETLYKKIKEDKEYNKLDTIQLKIISKIILYYKSELKSDKLHSFFRNKIKIDFIALVNFSKQPLFRTNSKQANETTKWLLKNKYISSKSRLYPVNSKYLTSTLSLSFLQVDLPTMDKILNLRNNLIEEYKKEKDIGLYIFFRLFQVKKIYKENIIKINLDKNIFKIDDELFLFVDQLNKHQQGYIPLVKYIFDKSIIQIIKESGIKSFDKTLDYYEKETRKYIKVHHLTYIDVQNSIKFDYSYNNCQFDLTLKTSKSYPSLNLSEVEYLFPNIIQKNLLDIEKNNEKIYFNNFGNKDIDFDDEILDSNYKATEYIKYDIESYDKLKQCINIPFDEKKFAKYLEEYYKLILNFKNNSEINYLFYIFEFTEIILKKSDRQFNKKPIKKTTLKEYLRILFKYCFNYIIIEGKLSKEVLIKIKENINIFENEELYKVNSDLTIRTTKRYYRLIKLFWKKYSNLKTESSLKMIVDIRRSIVFKEEIESFCELLINDKPIQHKRNNKFIKSIKQIFCLILYYTGLRRTELQTLLSKNIELVNEKEFEIMITKENFKITNSKLNQNLELKEKSDSAIRLVRFCVDNKKNLIKIKEYLKYIEKNKIQFMFPNITKQDYISKNDPISKDYFSDLPKKLAEHTKRYTPLHSLRHSYATFKALSLFEEENFLVYELSKTIGHSEPIVTLENYIHIDLLYLFKMLNIRNQIPNLKTNYQLDLI